jgi:hypothetical protein
LPVTDWPLIPLQRAVETGEDDVASESKVFADWHGSVASTVRSPVGSFAREALGGDARSLMSPRRVRA